MTVDISRERIEHLLELGCADYIHMVLLEAKEAAETDAFALVAEAYEVAARECEGSNLGLDPADVADDIRDLTPSDALAAREADRKRVRDEALREAASHFIEQDIADEILALIEGDQTDG